MKLIIFLISCISIPTLTFASKTIESSTYDTELNYDLSSKHAYEFSFSS